MSDFPRLSKIELFGRLAEGLQAGITVVTPNRRLAQELVREFDATASRSGLQAWEAADILPFGSFIERLWESAVYSELGVDTPLLSAAQEQALWEEIVAASPWASAIVVAGARVASVPRCMAARARMAHRGRARQISRQ